MLVILVTIRPDGKPPEDPAAAAQPQVTIDAFYMNPCEACETEEELAAKIKSVLSGIRDDVQINIRMNNTFHKGSADLLDRLYKKYDVPANIIGLSPVLFIGGTAIPVISQFEDQLRTAFLAAMPDQPRELPDDDGDAQADAISATRSGTDTTIIYFYVSPCRACEAVDAFYEGLDDVYVIRKQGTTLSTKIVIIKYDVGKSENLDLARKYFAAFKVPEEEQKTPIAFIGKTWLSGEAEIVKNLPGMIRDGTGLEVLEVFDDDGDPAGYGRNIEDYTAIGVFLTGLLNGLNPCSLSMLLLFLSLLVSRNENVLKLGFSFIAGKVAAYFALGVLFFNMLGSIDTLVFRYVSNFFKAILLVIITAVIILNIIDAIAAKHEKYGKIRLQLPAALRKANHRWIHGLLVIKDTRFLMPYCFGLGIVIAAGEFMCAGQLYLATILQMLHASKIFDFRAAGCFLLYDAALVIPLSLLVLAIHKGMAVFNLTEAIRRKMPWIKIANALVFFAFGMLFLLME